MARKLPWATGDNAASKPTIKRESPSLPSTPRQPKRRKREDAPLSSPLRRRSRSTSPPPAFPAIDPMVEEDDIYIMVEDEFNEVAGTFTAHLHRAEYQRRVKAARNAPPRTLLPVSPMSKATKRRVEQDILQTRQQNSLEDIGVNGRAERSDDRSEDLWRGTHLGGLIRESHEDVSLKGLELLPSSTRAAQGFTRVTDHETGDKLSEVTTSARPRNQCTSTTASVDDMPAIQGNGSKADRQTRPLNGLAPSREIQSHVNNPSTISITQASTTTSIANNTGSIPDPQQTLPKRPQQHVKKFTPLLERKTIKKEEPLEMPMWL